MKIKSLALLICATLASSAALADNQTQLDLAAEGHAYPAIMVKMKAASSLARQQLPSLLNLHDDSLNISAPFQHTTARGTEISELQALDAKYGFDRYLRIAIPADKTHDAAWINQIVDELKKNPNVEVAYADPEAATPVTESLAMATPKASVPDYRHLQYYLRAPGNIPSGFKIGGINRDSVNQYAGHDGANVTVLSNEIGKWNENHINLPRALFSLGTPNPNDERHDTASVGIIAGKDIGTGIRGVVWNTQVAYASYGATNLYNAIPKLQAGDVVQIGTQIYFGSFDSCTNSCWLPLEATQANYDVIKALTDKGVHVVELAGNAAINLDHSSLGGRFNLSNRDSGAIIVGAIDPTHGVRAYFSDYGSRVTSASWGFNVTTTGYGYLSSTLNADYTDGFNGTSSATPIVSGAVASLSSIAKAHGKTISPRQMRDILNQTGTPLPGDARIGTQPDMGRAVVKILGLDSENNSPAPVITVDHSTINTVSSLATQGYSLVATSDQEGVSWQWRFLSGNNSIYLTTSNSDRTVVVIPSNLDETQTTFQVIATNSSGKSTTSNITINVVKPAVTVTGAISMSASQPVKLQAQANFEQASFYWRLLKSGQAVANGIDQNGQMASGLAAGDYVVEVTATSNTQGLRSATTSHNIKVTSTAQNTDAAFINDLKMTMSATDNGSSVTFNGSTTSGTAATSTPTYNWALPTGAQGSGNGLSSQRFTITKTSQVQTLSVNVTVNAGNQSRVLTQTITVPAKEVVNTDAAFINGLKMALSSTDNGSSVTFTGNATSGTAATSTPAYRWALPAGAQGSNSGLATQSFTVNKTSQAQTLSLNVTVNAGSQSRVLTQTLTVPALVNTGGYPAWAFGTAYKTGDIVSHKGKNYKCTVGNWCAQNGPYSQLHYEPGVGLSWSMAWKLN